MADRYAEVAVLHGSPLQGAFTYAVPDDLQVQRGAAVVVPWRSQWAVGIVLRVVDASEVADPRPITRVLGSEAVLSARELELASWIAEHYLAPISDAVGLFLPPGAPKRPRAKLGLGSLIPRRPSTPKRLELAITDNALRDVVESWPMSKRSKAGDLLAALAEGELDRGSAAGIVGGPGRLDDWLSQTSMASADSGGVRLSIAPEEALGAADSLRRTAVERRQLSLLRLLEGGSVEEAEARRLSGANRGDLDSLEAAGLVRRVEVSSPEGSGIPESAPTLTSEQASAVGEIVEALDSDGGEVFLLHGVTGSGKTEVYLSAAGHALATGGGVIVLVPEIALAPQTIARFEARFPGQVAVRHSGLKRAEAREQWRQVYSGEKRILIGARSALFGPMRNLALVIIDEEHEWTYKQAEPDPRYHAGTVARRMSREMNVVTVLGSATPDVVSMAEARAGGSRLLRLKERIQSDGGDSPRVIPQPVVDVVDLREELAAGVRSVFSRLLDAAVSDALSRDEQVLLFLNRRGLAALVCRACGSAVGCARCSVAMTLHRPGPYLQCHECGERQAAPRRCPSCEDERIGAMSFGTAQLESEVRRRWGDVPITRWDRDTAALAGSHESLLREFADGRSRFLIGTQMIAKGLDLPRRDGGGRDECGSVAARVGLHGVGADVSAADAGGGSGGTRIAGRSGDSADVFARASGGGSGGVA